MLSESHLINITKDTLIALSSLEVPGVLGFSSSFSVHGLSRQEYWSGLPFLTPRDLLASSAVAGGYFTICSAKEAP